MGAKINIILNQKYKSLRVISLEESRHKNGERVYKCICDCGMILPVKSSSLNNKLYYEKCPHVRFEDLTNKVYGNIKIININNNNDRHGIVWNYKCLICDEIKFARADTIKAGQITSCGKEECKFSKMDYSIIRVDRQQELDKCKNWRQNILGKYNYKCQICESTNKLRAHHLDGYHWCVEKRFDTKNGICLCLRCHNLFHTKYGIKNNTKAQFIEFQQIYRLH